MLTLAIALLAAQTPQHRLFQQPNLASSQFAFFEAFPSSGAGTFGACSTTPPTGARGEVLTFTRASAATCTRTASGGLATTGIADSDLITLSTNVARVEYDSSGVLGLRVEAAATNLLLRFIEACDAAWSDVGTPALTGATVTGTACATATPQASPFAGTFATAAVMIEDNDAAAQEGRSQAVTVSAGAAHTMHCLVKGGSLAEASISLDGTAQTITGLSATTWSIVQVTDASSSGVSISARILNGDAVGDTGTVIWGGCQVETGSYRHSITPTVSAAVTRALETMKVNGATFPTATVSKAVTITTEWSQAQAPVTWGLLMGEVGTTSGSDFFGVGSGVRTQNCSGSCTAITSGALSIVAGTAMRLAADSSGGQSSIYKNGVSVLGPSALTAAASPWSSTTGIADNGAGVGHLDGIISRVCVDPSPERCR